LLDFQVLIQPTSAFAQNSGASLGQATSFWTFLLRTKLLARMVPSMQTKKLLPT